MQIQLLLQEGGEDPTITISSFKLCGMYVLVWPMWLVSTGSSGF